MGRSPFTELDADYLLQFYRAVERRSIHRDYSRDSQNLILDLTRDQHPLALSSEKWLALQYLCLRNGLFTTAFFAREHAIESAYAAAESDQVEELVTAFRAAIDRADFVKAEAFLERIRAVHPRSDLIGGLKSYYDLSTGDLEGFQAFRSGRLAPEDTLFLKAIEGKRIAIVGPAPSDELCGEEIDSFDVVVRMKYTGHKNMPEAIEFGNRVDISYYGIVVSDLLAGADTGFFEDINHAVFKSIAHDYQRHLVKAGKARCMKKNVDFFNQSPLETNHAIFDLFHFKPAAIKLFKVNFYLTKNPYYSGYIHNKQISNYFDQFDFRGFAHHDILSNINFARNLMNAKILQMDAACGKVTALTTYAYLKAMEDLIIQEPIREPSRG